MEFDQDLDATGLLCPLPVLKARKRIKGMEPGTILRLVTTDPAALVDVPHFCAEGGHDLLGQEEDGDILRFFIRKGGA